MLKTNDRTDVFFFWQVVDKSFDLFGLLNVLNRQIRFEACNRDAERALANQADSPQGRRRLTVVILLSCKFVELPDRDRCYG